MTNEPEYLTGNIQYIKPVQYWVETRVVIKWFFFTRIEYYICSEFMRLGPFEKAMDVTTTIQVLKK